jgi:kynurenine formamidase
MAFKVLDLTHALDEDTPSIPVPNITFPFKKTAIATVAKNGVAAYRWEIHEHLGTQIDAPTHFFEHGLTLDLLPVNSLVVPLVVIDVSARANSSPDTSVTVADIEAWEHREGRIPEHAAVMMASGWDSRIKDAKAFVNADAAGAMPFPGSRRRPPRFWHVRDKYLGSAWIRSHLIPGSMLRMPLTKPGWQPASGVSSWSRT